MSDPVSSRLARPGVLLLAVMAFAAALLLFLTRGQSFFADEWNYLVAYQDWQLHALLLPNSGSLPVAPAILYKVILELFGPRSYLPFRLVWVALDLACGAGLFLLARRRVGGWLAIAPATLLIFFGSAWELLGGPRGITELLTVVSGLGMLLCLERDDRVADLAACALLALSIASYTGGLAFAAGAAVELGVVRGRRGLRSAWIVVAPLVLYAAWRVWAAKYGGTNVGVANILTLPSSIATSLAAVSASIAGTFRDPARNGISFRLDSGYALSALLVALVVFLIVRPPGGKLDRRVWVFVAMPLTYWALIGANLGPLRAPQASRYQYLSAALVLLLLAQLFARVRVSRRATLAIAALTAVCLLGNIANLRDATNFLRLNGDQNRGELTALDLAGPSGRVAPAMLVEPISGAPSPTEDMLFQSYKYFNSVRQYGGSPAYTVAQLASRPEATRERADQELVRGLALMPVPARAPGGHMPLAVEGVPAGRLAGGGTCLSLAPEIGNAIAAFRLPPGGFQIEAGAPGVTLLVRRFAAQFTAPLSAPQPGVREIIAIPADAAPQPWHLQLSASAPVKICPP